MDKVISISEAKANLGKLVKKAQKGEMIYVGDYADPDIIKDFKDSINRGFL